MHGFSDTFNFLLTLVYLRCNFSVPTIQCARVLTFSIKNPSRIIGIYMDVETPRQRVTITQAMP